MAILAGEDPWGKELTTHRGSLTIGVILPKSGPRKVILLVRLYLGMTRCVWKFRQQRSGWSSAPTFTPQNISGQALPI